MKFSRFLFVLASGFLLYNIVFQVFAMDGDQHSPLRKAKNGIYVVAHRGAHIGIPENSLPAYQRAIDLGCDFIEIDVRTTKDGRFVSMHNSVVDEYVTGFSGKVSELSLDESPRAHWFRTSADVVASVQRSRRALRQLADRFPAACCEELQFDVQAKELAF